MKNKNRKGFTLIELLAVIVILAILILVALPAITSLTLEAKKGAYKSELLSFMKTIDSVYSSANLTGTPTKYTGTIDNGQIYSWSSSDGSFNGHYICADISWLANNGFIEKDNASQYVGMVEMWVSGEGKQTKFASVGNGQFFIGGSYQVVANASPKKDDVIKSSGDNGTSCNASGHTPATNYENSKKDKVS
jgi:prepilin-type N-terminal cleavage/methylation domain-containing protein